MNIEEIWPTFLKTIIEKTSLFSYNLWFKDLKFYKIIDNTFYILVPNDTNHDSKEIIKVIKEIYYNVVEDIIYDLTGNNYDIELIDSIPKEKKDIILISEDGQRSVEIESVYNKENKSNDYENYKYYNKFNPDYTFDSFVVGDSNRLAYSAAKAVAEKPGALYNPYFIYGKSGLGKTHLMHAIGNYIIQNTNKNVLYITAEEFKNDFRLISISKDENNNNLSYIEAFRNRYNNVDVLMIDDIQFLENATKTQQEFTNTFYSLYDNDKQIIVASDTSIEDLKKMEDRLKTRFSWGLTESINQPDVELKKEIVRNKIKLEKFDMEMDEDVIDFIALNCGNNIRNLEGTIIRLAAVKAAFKIDKITLDVAQNSLQEYKTDVVYKTNSIAKIINTIEKYYELPEGTLKGKRNKKNIADARALGMYLSRDMTTETLERIGLEFGGKSHSTVIHSWNKILQDMKINPELENDIKKLKEKISQ